MEKITVSVIINAEKSKVWEYYTHPDHIVHWNFADPSWHCPHASNDMWVGGVYKARMEAKDGSAGFDFEATYTDIRELESFSYDFGGRVATVVFKDVDGQTEIKITFDSESENPVELQKQGWQSILNNFKNYVETRD